MSPALFTADEEKALNIILDQALPAIHAKLEAEDYSGAMAVLSKLRAPLDAFFDQVIVNADDPALRINRLRLLERVTVPMELIADFSLIERK